jgi:hypothetical protein
LQTGLASVARAAGQVLDLAVMAPEALAVVRALVVAVGPAAAAAAAAAVQRTSLDMQTAT